MRPGQTVRIKIMGIEYTVTGYDDPNYLDKVAEIVDSRMRRLQEMQSEIPPHKNAILTALNLADELVRARDQLKCYREETAELNQNIAERSRRLSELCTKV